MSTYTYAVLTTEQIRLLDRYHPALDKVKLSELIDNALNIVASEIPNGSIDANKLATDAVETLKIKDLNVTEPKLASPGADGLNAKRIARATWDFAVEGGTKDTDIGLGVTIPDNAQVLRTWYEVITGMTSSGGNGTISFGVEAAGDILAPVDADTKSGLNDGIQDGTAANAVKTTAAKELIARIGTEDLTAGKVILFAEYVVTE